MVEVQVGKWWSGCQEGAIRLSSRLFRNSSPPQLECKEPCFAYCRLAIADWQAGRLPAAPRTRKDSDRGCSPPMRVVRQAGRLAARYRLRRQAHVCVCLFASFDRDVRVSAGCSRGLRSVLCSLAVCATGSMVERPR